MPDGPGPADYGDAFADVYDDWYADVSDVDATVRCLARLAAGGPVLELGIGTGRLALPLTRQGVEVHGVDASQAMVDRLRAKEGGDRIPVLVADMAAELPPGRFSVVFAAYNTFFNLPDLAAKARCLRLAVQQLTDGGVVVLECFVPGDGASGGSLEVRAVEHDRVVLSASQADPASSTAAGQFIEISGQGVRLRPWRVHHLTPAALDELAAGCGLELAQRWSGWDGSRFTDESVRHVSVYRVGAPEEAG